MLEITSPALEKLKEVLDEQGEKESALRVIAVPAEHGGVQYMMTMEKEVQRDDTILDMDGIRFLMDSDSEPFLEEATIDYVEELTRVGFVINNPMFASAGCGCGAGGGGCGGGNGGCGCGSGH